MSTQPLVVSGPTLMIASFDPAAATHNPGGTIFYFGVASGTVNQFIPPGTPLSNLNCTPTMANVEIPLPRPGNILNLCVQGGQAGTASVLINGAISKLARACDGTLTQFFDRANVVPTPQGAKVAVQLSGGGNGTWHVSFEFV